MRFGICVGPGSFAPQAGDAASAVPRMMEVLQEAGADYVEFTVATVTPEGSEADFEKLRTSLAPYSIRVEAFNSFIPGHHRITGPDVDLQRVLNYCQTALERCRVLGAEVVVLGSAGARKVPPGFDHGRAEQQFIQFCRELGPVAEDIGVTIAIEPLNSREDNLILSVEHGMRVVDQVAHSHIQLLADLYHISQESEPLEHIPPAGKRLRHTHCADRGRAAPGFSVEGEENFLGFFQALRQAGYNARCSFEGELNDIETRACPLIAHLRQRWDDSAA